MTRTPGEDAELDQKLASLLGELLRHAGRFNQPSLTDSFETFAAAIKNTPQVRRAALAESVALLALTLLRDHPGKFTVTPDRAANEVILSPLTDTAEHIAEHLQNHNILIRTRLAFLRHGGQGDWPTTRITLEHAEELLADQSLTQQAEQIARYGAGVAYQLVLVFTTPLTKTAPAPLGDYPALLDKASTPGSHVEVRDMNGTTLTDLITASPSNPPGQTWDGSLDDVKARLIHGVKGSMADSSSAQAIVYGRAIGAIGAIVHGSDGGPATRLQNIDKVLTAVDQLEDQAAS